AGTRHLHPKSKGLCRVVAYRQGEAAEAGSKAQTLVSDVVSDQPGSQEPIEAGADTRQQPVVVDMAIKGDCVSSQMAQGATFPVIRVGMSEQDGINVGPIDFNAGQAALH